jgi:hypothetical protein
LYYSSLYSFRQRTQEINAAIKSKVLDPKSPIILTLVSDQRVEVAKSAYAFLSKNKSQFPRYLRETIFVRLISALEVFLIDIIKEIFIARRDLFHTDQTIEFSFGELLSADSITELWTKLINRELRGLQNQGFRKIVTFYKQRLNIDLANVGVDISAIEEFHERRHILVHRLGQTDDEYRHQYNYSKKLLSVTEKYLIDCLSTIDEFGHVVSEQAKAKIAEQPDKPLRRDNEIEIKIVLELSSTHVEFILDRDFSYKIGDAIGRLGDILLSHEKDGYKDILTIGGDRASIKGYIKELKKIERQNDLVIHEKTTIRWQKKRRAP